MLDHYFIDAYNVIHKSSYLRQQAQRDLELARETLLEMSFAFSLVGQNEITVVFDGKELQYDIPILHRLGNAPNLHIFFSPHGTTADTVIERKIYQAQNRMRCIVVSNDRSLREQCRGMGAMTMEADSFISTIKQMQQRTQEQLSSRVKSRATLIEDRLNSRSLEALAAIREEIVSAGDKRKKR